MHNLISRLARIARATSLGLLLLAGGCGAPRAHHPNNIVAVDADGTLRTFSKHKKLIKTPLPRNKLESQQYTATNRNELDFIFRLPNPELEGQSNIVIFIQGGLNDVASGIKRADKLSEAIMDDPIHPAYPIFLAWDADLFSAWCEQYSTHRGQQDKTFGYFLAPWTFLANLGRYATRLPLSMFEQGYAAARTARSPAYGHGTNVPALLGRPERVNRQYEKLRQEGYQVQFEPGVGAAWPRTRATWMFLETAPKIISEGVVDTGGKIGWDFMLRRTRTMFTLSTPEFNQGGMDFFAEELTYYMEQHPEKNLTIVGHSMGSIVANEILRRYGEQLRVSNIVYMAAACGVDDCEHVVIPYLLSHPGAQFYNLSLHPGNDLSELPVPWWAGAIAPRGSLLDWIDYYYSSADTDYGWTLGKWDNAILGSQRFLSQQSDDAQRTLKTQVHFKCFGYGPESKNGPQHHGGFDRWEFWNPDFWQNVPYQANWLHKHME